MYLEGSHYLDLFMLKLLELYLYFCYINMSGGTRFRRLLFKGFKIFELPFMLLNF
jgi:hypothetical protein